MRKRLIALLMSGCLLTVGLLSGCEPQEAGESTSTESTAPTTAPTTPVPTGPFHTYMTDAEYDEIVSARAPQSTTALPALCINGTQAVYESQRDAYFFSVAADEYWQALTPTVEGYTAQYVTRFEDEDKVEFLKSNEPAKLLVYNDTTYAQVSVVFTSLPVLALNTQTLPETLSYFDKDEEQETQYDTDGNELPYEPYAAPSDDPDKPIGAYDTFLQMTLLDGEAAAHGYENGFSSPARAHIRGRSSRYYPKNNYKLELLEEENGVLVERDETLLGMRSDGDWNLNGMYAEPTKVRDKVCADLWVEMTADREVYGYSTGYRCEYIEVIINGRYHGLYLMTERVDRKQMGLEDGDLMYFSEGDLGKHYMDFLSNDDPNEMEISGYSLKWPKERSAPFDEWVPFGELTKLITATNRENFKAQAPEMIDLESLADYEMFVQVICGTDNLIQNTFYIARQQEDGSYVFSFVPWDMDQSFGMCWGGEQPYLTIEDYWGLEQRQLTFWVSDAVTKRNTAGYNDILTAKYTELRETLFDDTALIKRINNAQAQLTDAGAWARDLERWPDSRHGSVSQIRSFIVNRMDYLDALYLAE